jgi:hypothetical protein
MSAMQDNLVGASKGSLAGESNKKFSSQFRFGQDSSNAKTSRASKYIMETNLYDYGR